MLAVIPVRDGILPAGGAEAVAECGGAALVIGSGALAAAAELASHGVTVVEAGTFRPAAWATALARVLRGESGSVDVPMRVVLPASPDGRDLAPRLAAELELPLFAGAVRVTPHHVVLAREGGLQMHTVVPPDAFVATLQPGVRGVELAGVGGTAEAVHVLEIEIGDAADALVERVLAPDASTMDLAEAKRIVGGGAGLDSAEQFERLGSIGAAIGASVGATRVITDRGWIGHERQIGTTGVVVQPDLYLAFGVSGAVQHTSGLGHPHHIVSVNTDPHCPMMQLADLAVVADANAVLAELVALLDLERGAPGEIERGADREIERDADRGPGHG